ncbi:MAG: NAD(P)H-hydrate dehydratase [Firmicutes bacterium]|nr:NAD(P)H-hydrate dehydratase [Bacillota bacterium]
MIHKTLTESEIKSYFPARKADTHKGDYGKILMLCGSRGFTGAAALAAMGALRVGAGLVYCGVPESIYAIEAVKLTEPVVFPLPDREGKLDADAAEQIAGYLPKMDVVCMGCGLGISTGTEQVTEFVLKSFRGPVLLDADGINLMAAHKDILRDRTAPTILTPHAGEFLRFSGREANPETVEELARELSCILLSKGHRTIITDGQVCYHNPTGNPGMASGGSGDVLAGVIAGLLGQGLPPLEAAAVGAWLHGKAGDVCAASIGEYGMVSGDLLEVLPRLLF